MQRVFAAFVAAILLTGCASAGIAGAMLPPTSSNPAAGRSSSTLENGVKHSVKERVAIRLTIPRTHHKRGGRMSPNYISPSIASAELWAAADPGSGRWTLDSGYPIRMNLTPSSNGCSTSGGATVCEIVLTGIPTGQHLGLDWVFFDSAGNVVGANAQDGSGTTCPPTSGLCYSDVGTPDEGETFAFNLTIDGVVDHVRFGQTHLLTEGVAGSTPLSLVAFDADGNQIVGPGQWTDAQGRPASINVVQSRVGPPFSITSSGPDCVGGVAVASSCAFTLHYDGSNIMPPKPVGWSTLESDAILVTQSSVGTVLIFYPIVAPATVLASATSPAFASNADPAQTVATGVPAAFGASVPHGGTLTNGLAVDLYSACPTVAGLVNSVSSILVTPTANGSCVAPLEIVSSGAVQREAEQMPITVGGGTPTAWEVAPSSLAFASASSANANLDVVQYGPGALSGPATFVVNWCTSPGPLDAPLSAAGTSNPVENYIAQSAVFSADFTAQNLTGNQTATFAVTPKGAGECDLSVSTAGITPPVGNPDSDANRYFVTVGF